MFVGSAEDPRQVVRVEVVLPVGVVGSVVVHGRGTTGSAVAEHGVVEVPLATTAAPGQTVPVVVELATPVGHDRVTADLLVAEPGWSVHLVPHFHFDPVWWNHQGASVSEWAEHTWSTAPQLTFQSSAFDVLLAHLRRAEADPDYRFVVAEVDYLKPFRDRFPVHRRLLDALVAAGRVEVVGGAWNQPDTVLSPLEATRRNFVLGTGYQREVLGARPRTAWALDVFGHAPQYPAVVADAGLTAVAFARGPFHQWGPLRDDAFAPMTAAPASFPTDFRWSAPGGRQVQAHGLPGHYTAGHPLDGARTVEEAMALVLEWFVLMRGHAAARSVLIPVGTDLSPPDRWVTEVGREWSRRWVWPRVQVSLPGAALASVPDDADRHRTGLRVQTRDMNPVYTGKDVTHIGVKQAHAATCALVLDAETWAALASTLTGATHPDDELDRAWRLLVYGAHHDAVTGTCSDQVYLDLLTGWREAYDHAQAVLSDALRALAPAVGGVGVPVVLADAAGTSGPGLVTFRVPGPPGARGLRVVDVDGTPVPAAVDHATRAPDGTITEALVTVLVERRRGVGLGVLRVVAAGDLPTWSPAPGPPVLDDGRLRAVADPTRGGGLTALVDLATGTELLAPGGVGGELVVADEHPTHPHHGEGPWHLLPTGRRSGTGSLPAEVRREVSPLGQRLVATGPLPGGGQHRTTTTLLVRSGAGGGVDRLEFTVDVDDLPLTDQLLRTRWPLRLPGARPVLDAGEAVIGRGWGFPDVDAAVHPWTLDTAAATWTGVGAPVVVTVRDVDDGGALTTRAIAVAEVVHPPDGCSGALADQLVAALGRVGVTATATAEPAPRHGHLARDSNLPDVRFLLADVDRPGAWTRELLTDPSLADAVAALGPDGAVLWAPPHAPLDEVWGPGADLTGHRDLPVVLVVGPGQALARLVDEVVDDLVGRRVTARHHGPLPVTDPPAPRRVVALAAPGTPSSVVDTDGALHLSLLRASTAWPAGEWIDPPRRTAPDGSSFALQHWSQRFAYTLLTAVGDHDQAVGAVHRAAAGLTRPLRTAPLPAPLAAPDDGTPTSDGGTGWRALLDPGSDAVLLSAVKLRGNPLATGRRPGAPGSRGLTVRLHTVGHAPVETCLQLPWAAPAWAADLHETAADALPADGGRIVVGVPAAGATTVVTGPPPTLAPGRCAPGPSAARPTGAESEASRWWTRNSGPPPLGGLPVAVHVHETRDAATGQPRHTVTVASDLAVEPVDVLLSTHAPPGVSAVLDQDRVRLAPGGWSVVDLRVAGDPAPAGAAHVVTVHARPDLPGLRATSDHLVLDRHRAPAVLDLPGSTEGVLLGHPGGPGTPPEGMVVVAGPPAGPARAPGLHLPPGGWGWLELPVRSRATVPVPVEVVAISPAGAWLLLPSARAQVVLPAGDGVVRVPVVVPAGTRPGAWWVVVALRGPDAVVHSRAAPVQIAPGR